MLKIAISSGHGLHIRGARGNPVPPQLDERDENVKVVDRVAAILNEGGVVTAKYHDDKSTTQNANLSAITSWHNNQVRDYDISVHFNAYDHTAHGTEVLYVSQADLAAKVSLAVSDAGNFTNRGAKKNTGLAFLNNTDKPAILIETCFCDNTNDSNKYRASFEKICHAIAASIAGNALEGKPPLPPIDVPIPPERPPVLDELPTISKGDTGPDVKHLQEVLGVLEADGDFGSITDAWVLGFQSACGLASDGIVGPATWTEVGALQASVADGEPRIPKALADQIYTLAMASEIADYSWPDRGMPPPGYIAGMAQAFGYALRQWNVGDQAARVMGQAIGDADEDALAWYSAAFAASGMTNKTSLDRLRHTFVLMIGLGPRESSGRYCEGRDMSATNVQSETAEAGLFQTSWNIKGANPAIAPLLDDFWSNPNGFLSTFKEGVVASANNLSCYGSGDGARYQWLSRFCPLFHILVTGVGLRTLRQHWGPINRREVSVQPEAETLLLAVQDLVRAYEAVA